MGNPGSIRALKSRPIRPAAEKTVYGLVADDQKEGAVMRFEK
jgi:hypothetical protein